MAFRLFPITLTNADFCHVHWNKQHSGEYENEIGIFHEEN